MKIFFVRINASDNNNPKKNFAAASCLEKNECTKPKHVEDTIQNNTIWNVDNADMMGNLNTISSSALCQLNIA